LYVSAQRAVKEGRCQTFLKIFVKKRGNLKIAGYNLKDALFVTLLFHGMTNNIYG